MRSIRFTGIAAALYLAASASMAADVTQIPDNIRSQFGPDDTIIAMKSASPLGLDASGTVVAVRYASDDPQKPAHCELIVFRGDHAKVATSEHNSNVVDCINNETNKTAGTLAANDQLTVTPTQIAYVNLLPRGGTAYTFNWCRRFFAWHLQRVEASSVHNGEKGPVVRRSTLDFPMRLTWINLSDFDPKLVRDDLAKNLKTVK